MFVFGGVAFAETATQFSFPVGDKYTTPINSTSGSNGYHISQEFNTGQAYEPNPSMGGGYCFRNNQVDPNYITKSSCETAGGKWYWGHTGMDIAKNYVQGESNCGGQVATIANGVIKDVLYNHASYGNHIRIEHDMPDGTFKYSTYSHMQSITSGLTVGTPVFEGQEIGKVGTTGNSGGCHLHLEVRALNSNGSGYLYSDPDNKMKDYRDSLLFIEDRLNGYQLAPSAGTWTLFSVSSSSPSKTAYVTYGSESVSITEAIARGWMYQQVQVWYNGAWYYYNNVEKILFEPGNTYRVYAFQNVGLNLFYPAGTFPDSRARQDMVAFGQEEDARFTRARRDTYATDLNWLPDWELRWMQFDFGQGGSNYMYHATNKNDPLMRMIQYYDNDTGQWSPWIQVY